MYLDEADLRLISKKLNIYVPSDDDSNPVLQILTEDSGFKMMLQEVLIYKLKSRSSMLSKIDSVSLYPNEVDVSQAAGL